jgi:hypothetical protein
MPRRPAIVTQADVARSIRAVMAAGLTIIRVVTRPDGVSIETATKGGEVSPSADLSENEPKKVVL